ncbi:MAG: hypothetical protein IPN33_02970 [Saprospiraceae bacterium]|nr:hypothetical protein [Saprospiraceae bacterium]
MPDTIDLRPRFQQYVAIPPSEVVHRLQTALNEHKDYVRGSVYEQYIVLSIPAEKQHFWSPRLTITIEPKEEGSMLRGLFGPLPSIWLMFVFGYGIIGFISMIAAIIGFSRMSLGLSTYELWILPVCAILAAGMYAAGKTGQRLGRDEMEQIYVFMGEALGRE